ncbi:MAG: DMT family transporter [Negativicutes bacterium]
MQTHLSDGSNARREHNRAILFLLLAALLWSTGGFFIKWVEWNPMAISGGRSAISALVIAFAFRHDLKLTWSPLQLAGAFAYALTVTFFVIANKMTTAANAILLQYTAPVHVALLSTWLLQEHPTRRDWLTIFAVLGGMLLFFFEKMSPGNLIGNLCALFTGLTFALFIVLLRKQRDASPAGSVFLGNVLTALAGVPFMFDSLPSPAGWAGLIFLGVFQLGLAYVLYTLAISHVTAMEAVLITLIEPILNPFWVFILMGEIPAWTSLAGGLVIIGSVTARQLAGVRR